MPGYFTLRRLPRLLFDIADAATHYDRLFRRLRCFAATPLVLMALHYGDRFFFRAMLLSRYASALHAIFSLR